MISLEDIARIAEVEFSEIYPYHFHDGSQSNAADSSFAKDVLGGFHEFMKWIQERLL